MSGAKHPLFERMEVLSTELCQTQAFILRALERAGLHVVTDAGKRVLDAMALVPEVEVEISLDLRDHMSVQERRAWEAELARRGEKT